MLAARWPLSILLQTFVSMIGLGLGMDYALLSVSRFREALAASGDPVRAAVATGRSAGRTILLSGLTVALGFAALLAVPLGELRSVAVGGLLATAFAMLVGVTLLPALLAWLGRRIEAGRLWPARRAVGARWRAWGDRKSTRLNSSHITNSYAVFCLKKKNGTDRGNARAHT